MTILKPFGSGVQQGCEGTFVPSCLLRVILGDMREDVADRLHRRFHDVAAVEVVRGNLLEAGADAIVSPANSFGDMGGGIDKAIDDWHGGEAQRKVRERIEAEFLGELPVGMAAVVETKRRPWVVAAPTMRVPMVVAGTLNAYLAMRAALVAALRNGIGTLAVPGLCTGVGGMDAATAAEQMRTAWDNVVGGGWRAARVPALAPYAMAGWKVRPG